MEHDELVMVTQKIVRGGVRRAGLPQDAIDDLVQDVLFKYLNRWPHPDAPGNPAAWLQRAANNAVIDYLRRDQRRPAVNFAPDGDDPLSLLMATLRAAGTPSLGVVADAVWQDALALVSDQDAAVLRRRFMDAVPAADLAAEYGVSRAVIDQRTARAKKRIQAALTKRPDLVTALQSPHQHTYLSDRGVRRRKRPMGAAGHESAR
ncbi:RNA polymerase sigma factor [Nocardioides psychrotolerans]|uniref:RNA polymerase sigma factor, sigma-70 family n=1 Tax=Nocardioides psychrotolerans TaxID=1005945 RepID=A0A1I3R994_9ACTN|nr:sigma-70 family RNA polymerase sigma factor [Nocardioides psychrotolerans]SFJ41917.1 RNA polymerase sigma factor, sigma-70 family [Nocardioides psychrotolerans]